MSNFNQNKKLFSTFFRQDKRTALLNDNFVTFTGSEEIPCNMYHNDKKVPENEIADCFATYFEGKVDKIVKNARVDQNVYCTSCAVI